MCAAVGSGHCRPRGDTVSLLLVKKLAMHPERFYSLILGGLAFAFFWRVLGQVMVYWRVVDFLPPMEQWQSGLLPYPVLLGSQIAIMALQAKTSTDLWRGSGFFAIRRPLAGTVVGWVSYVYFAGMVLRYVLTMTWHPERRWFGGTIPIFFHFVLAGYLWVYSRFCLQRGACHAQSSRTA